MSEAKNMKTRSEGKIFKIGKADVRTQKATIGIRKL